MRYLLTVLLRHETRQGVHYDWLLENPETLGDPSGRLWAVRVGWPSRCWRCRGVWLLQPIAPHRRRYLTYQGPIGGGQRGQVRRIDGGWYEPRLWTRPRIVVNLMMRGCRGLIEMQQLGEDTWRTRFMPGGPWCGEVG